MTYQGLERQLKLNTENLKRERSWLCVKELDILHVELGFETILLQLAIYSMAIWNHFVDFCLNHSDQSKVAAAKLKLRIYALHVQGRTVRHIMWLSSLCYQHPPSKHKTSLERERERERERLSESSFKLEQGTGRILHKIQKEKKKYGNKMWTCLPACSAKKEKNFWTSGSRRQYEPWKDNLRKYHRKTYFYCLLRARRCDN